MFHILWFMTHSSPETQNSFRRRIVQARSLFEGPPGFKNDRFPNYRRNYLGCGQVGELVADRAGEVI